MLSTGTLPPAAVPIMAQSALKAVKFYDMMSAFLACHQHL
jgi:hypothetical protein